MIVISIFCSLLRLRDARGCPLAVFAPGSEPSAADAGGGLIGSTGVPIGTIPTLPEGAPPRVAAVALVAVIFGCPCLARRSGVDASCRCADGVGTGVKSLSLTNKV